MANASPLHHVYSLVKSLLLDRRYFWTLASFVLIGDVVLTEIIIKFISYTEIDWETYMIQTELYIKGQYNYSLISGPTGPLVYPAGHVRIHEYLYRFTDAGRDIRFAQHIYGILYILTLTVTCAIYHKAQNIPNWVLLLLPLSKRLHSIFVLRLFNDCWALFLMTLSILAYQFNLDDTGILFYGLALSVKMSILLYLPGLLVIIFKRRGLVTTLRQLLTIIAIQALLASPFISEDPWSYLKGAFDLGRVFLYKWTVNWRFVDEGTFLNPTFALSLLVGHISVLVAFGLFKWCKLDGGVWKVLDRGLRRPRHPAGLAPTTPDYTATVLFTSNLIGILFARSLHYQFYSWYSMQIPFLAWRTRYPIILKLALLLMIEYAWNVYPSTDLSSAALLAGNSLLLIGVWFGYPNGASIAPVTASMVFPDLAPKQGLECRTILEDQILVIDEFLSPAECKIYAKFIDNLPLELTPPKKRGEAERVNYRFSVASLDFAQRLHTLLTPHLPSFPYPSWSKKKTDTDELRLPHSFNSNIRMYKYCEGQYFGPHYDDSVKDTLTGVKSEWTLLIYLSGIEDGVEGGETVFYREERGKPRESIVPQLNRGTALLHRHGQNCMLHEGSPVKSGTKYVLRSDLMFMG
ncbi:hypothetical protein AGABI1DRAFT_118456 [Agaricus bisporus var. burnettii JB137-S8]|uniref:Dol-P-Man:Man(5)GlcNAc(2)-PP-Dol alpha-1,3-mannosyltransferase n=1 Tax=Agaricus bisporus var. burnettii (strain JB137-S8 / ATCC MYA-4627 / FGSC 10392) TaxID=597362 RepID=K5XHY8_AGABU|nr:uncharacterized protein AGABI1DRAFT_118456 [Agaricus bisporus var. burnettii JB137-S8]EKM83063.1 hypothetical protein AGABI1DRAFT_118456 [Agaricus bisporus var. burnettii JB137-S8]